MRQIRHTRKLLFLGFFSINIIVIVLTLFSLFKSQQQYELHARSLSQNIASALDHNVSSTIDKIDVVLDSVVEQIKLNGAEKLDKSVVNASLNHLVQRMPEVEGIRLSNKDGLIVLGSGENKAVSISDRDYFIYHCDNIDSKLKISKPLWGRIVNHYILILSRRYNDPDGRFAGVVYATINLDYFAKLMTRFNLGPDDTIILRSSDLGLITRYPDISPKPAGTVGNSDVSKEFRQLADSGVQQSTYHTPTSADGIERTFSFRRLEHAPFIVLAGLATKEYMADWYKEVYQLLLINFGFVLLTVMSGYSFIKSFNGMKEIADRLNEAQQIAHIGSWTLEKKNGKLRLSDEIFRLLEMDPKMFDNTYQGFINLIHQEDRDAVTSKFAELFANLKGFEINHRLLMADGRIKWIQQRVSTVFDSEEAPLQYQGTFRDITERHNKDEMISRVQANLTAAQKLAHIGSWDRDLKNNALTWSDESYRIFGLDRNDPGNLRENFLKLLSTNTYLPEANCLFAFLHNITHRKQAESALRIAATTFETHEAIMITDAKANIIRVNQAFQKTTGYSAEDVIGKNPSMFKSGKHDSEFYADMWKGLLESGVWSGEIWDKRKDGQIFPKWMTITAVKNNAGETTEYVAIFSDITERKKAEDEIHSLAFFDPLTKLPNRRHLLDRANQAQLASKRSSYFGALLFLDMDRFKTLNDTLGHDYGDLFLKVIANRLQNSVRDIDTVARVGGDEFVVLMENIDLNPEEASQKVAVIAEKIRSSLTKPYHLEEHEHHSSPSIGVSLYRGNEVDLETIFKQADMAMYQAKESGGNAVRFFDPAMQIAVQARAAIEADLRHAVPEKHLCLYYQIQIDNDSKPIGAEALIRWIHPVRGVVSPLQFIPIAEESSLILEIGHWVMETACKQLAMWSRTALTSHLILAVNVSAKQFKRHDFVESIAMLVNIHNINPNLLKLELTESIVLSDVTDVISKMHMLKAMGIRLSLDDFGTGYSSLSYLKKLPLDQIKIDQSFVRDMTIDSNDAVMVKTIINLANNFRVNVIAEGVETEAQLKSLKDNGCMAYQGYLFSKPVPIEEFEALLTQM